MANKKISQLPEELNPDSGFLVPASGYTGTSKVSFGDLVTKGSGLTHGVIIANESNQLVSTGGSSVGYVLTWDTSGPVWQAPSGGGGQTLYDYVLDINGSGDFTSIQQMADLGWSTFDNKTIFVKSGGYSISGNMTIATEGTRWIGEDARNTVIYSSDNIIFQSGSKQHHFENLKFRVDGSNFFAFTFGYSVSYCQFETQNDSGYFDFYGGGTVITNSRFDIGTYASSVSGNNIRIHGAYSIFKDNAVVFYKSPDDEGLQIDATNSQMIGNVFFTPQAGNVHKAMVGAYGDDLTFTNNSLEAANNIEWGYGISVASENAVIADNRFLGSLMAIQLLDDTRVTVTGNTISVTGNNIGAGIQVTGSGSNIGGLIISGNTIISSLDTGGSLIYLDSSYSALIANNTLNTCYKGIELTNSTNSCKVFGNIIKNYTNLDIDNDGTGNEVGFGNVVGPASSTTNAIALYADTTGKLLSDSAVTISTDGTLASDSDTLIPTEKAVKTYVDSMSTTTYDAIVAPIGGDYNSLSSAFATLTGNVTILVKPGTYTELGFDGATTNPGLLSATVIGAGDASILDFGANNFKIEGDQYEFKNIKFTFTDGIFTDWSNKSQYDNVNFESTGTPGVVDGIFEIGTSFTNIVNSKFYAGGNDSNVNSTVVLTGYQITLDNCEIQGYGTDAIVVFQHSTSYNKLTNSTVSGTSSSNAFSGVELRGSIHTVHNNLIMVQSSVGSDGIKAISMGTQWYKITNNTIRAFYNNGIIVGLASENIISNNILESTYPGVYAIYVYDSSQNTINGNNINLTDAAASGIVLDNTSNNNNIVGNVVDAPDTGIIVNSSSSNDNLLSSNELTLCGTAITDNGTNTTIINGAGGTGQVVYDAIVAPTGGDYTTLGAAIAAASSGWNILVKPGTYAESTINSTIGYLNIYGEGVGTCTLDFTASNGDFILDGNFQNISNITISMGEGQFFVNGDSNYLENIEIIDSATNPAQSPVHFNSTNSVYNRIHYYNNNPSYAYDMNRVLVTNANNKFTNCEFNLSLNNTTSIQAVYVGNTAHFTSFTNCKFDFTSGLGTAVGLRIYTADYCTIDNCTFNNDTTTTDIAIEDIGNYTNVTNNHLINFENGIYAGGSYSGVISNNLIKAGGTTGYGVYLDCGDKAVVNNNHINIGGGGTSKGINVSFGNNHSLTGNTVETADTGVYVASGVTDTMISSNSLSGLGTEIDDNGTSTKIIDGTGGGGGQTLYDIIVAPTGGDYTTLSDALAAATSGQTIFVRSGTYVETNLAGVDITTTNLTIIGENKKSTVVQIDEGYSLPLRGANTNVYDLRFELTSSGTQLQLGLVGNNSIMQNCEILCTATASNTPYQFFTGGDYTRLEGCKIKIVGNYDQAQRVVINSDYGWVVNCDIELNGNGTTGTTFGTFSVEGSMNTISNNLFRYTNTTQSSDSYKFVGLNSQKHQFVDNKFNNSVDTTKRITALFVNGSKMKVNNNRFEYTARSIYCSNNTNDLMFNDNYFIQTDYAIQMDSSNRAIVDGNFLQDVFYGIKTQGTDITVSNNRFKSTEYPINNTAGGDQCTSIIGNTINGASIGKPAIENSGGGVMISNNTTFFAQHGIKNSGDGVYITSNKCFRNGTGPDAAIYNTGAAVVISNNEVGGQTGKTIYNSGANTVVANNFFSDDNDVENTSATASIYNNMYLYDWASGNKSTGTYNNEYKTVFMKNVSGGTLAAGDVVVFNATSGSFSEVTTTTNAGDNKVFGIAVESIADQAVGKILVSGKTTVLKVNGQADISIGDYLSTYTDAGIAHKASGGHTAFAIALEAYTSNDSNGVIDAMLISPRTV